MQVDSPKYQAIELDYATSKVTNIKAAYHNISQGTYVSDYDTVLTGWYKKCHRWYPIYRDIPIAKSQSVHYWELGFDTKFAQDWALMATYAKSNINIADQDNKGYFTQLTYKAADLKKVGSYDVFANYRKVPVNSQIDATWDYARDVKGWSLGFDYVPAKNIQFQAFYLKGKTITWDEDANVYRAQLEFFF
jgi:hypothetical protein